MKCLICLLAALAGLGVARAELDISRNIPTTANIVARIRVNILKDSQLGSDLMNRYAERIGDAQVFVNEYIGFDPLLIEEAWLLSAKPDTGVVICRGDFPADLIAQRFGQWPEAERLVHAGCQYALRFPDKKKPGTMQIGAVIDATTLAIGDEASVTALLDTIAGTARALAADDPHLVAIRAAEAAVVGTMIDPARWPDMAANVRYLLKSVWLRLDLGTDADVRLDIETLDDGHALALADIGRGLSYVKANDPKWRKPLLKDILHLATFTAEGATATARVTVPGGTIQNLLAGVAGPR